MSRFGEFDGYLDSGAQYARACYARPLARLLSLLKSALVGGAVLGLIQPAFAVGTMPSDQNLFPTSGHGIYAALLDLDGPTTATTAASQRRRVSPVSTLRQDHPGATSLRRNVAVSRADGDAVFAELAEFAQRTGATAGPARAPLKLADADNASTR